MNKTPDYSKSICKSCTFYGTRPAIGQINLTGMAIPYQHAGPWCNMTNNWIPTAGTLEESIPDVAECDGFMKKVEPGALIEYPSKKSGVEVAIDKHEKKNSTQINCPGCGKLWDFGETNRCTCGTTVKKIRVKSEDVSMGETIASLTPKDVEDHLKETIEGVRTSSLIGCPSCGKPWETDKSNACECGATLEFTAEDPDLKDHQENENK